MQCTSFTRALRFGAPLAIALATLSPAARADGVPPASASPALRDMAQAHMSRGRDLLAANKLDEALAELRVSLELVSSPNTRLYVGRCLREAGRLVPAYVELSRTAADAMGDARYEKTRAAAEEERDQLAATLGLVAVNVAHASPDTTLTLAGTDVPREEWGTPVPVVAGSSELVVKTPNRPPITTTIDITAGTRQTLTIDAEPEAPPIAAATPRDSAPSTPELRPHTYVAGGVALAGLATFTVFGLMAGATHSDLEKACGAARSCPPGHGYENDVSAGRTQQTVANVGLVVFAVGTATAVTLFVVGSPKAAASKSAAAGAGPQVRIVGRGTKLGLEGSF